MTYELLMKCGTLIGYWSRDRLEVWQWVDGTLWTVWEDPSSEWFSPVLFEADRGKIFQVPPSISY